MALLEINLRQPALVEEVVEPGETGGSILGRTRRKAETAPEGGGGSILSKLAMAGLVLAAVGVVRAIRNRGSDESSQSEGVEVPIETGSSSEERGGGGRRRILAIALAVVGAAAAARRLRTPEND